MELRLGDNTSAAVKRGPVVLIPLGGVRDHGQGLPLDSESEIAVAIADLAAKALNRRGQASVVAPALNYGLATSDSSCPGEIRLSASSLLAVAQDAVESAASWAHQVVLVTLDARTEQILTSSAPSWSVGRCSARVMLSDLSVSGIGIGRACTSLMLFLKPWHVRLDGRSGHRVVASLGMAEGSSGQDEPPSSDEGRELLDTLVWQLVGELCSSADHHG